MPAVEAEEFVDVVAVVEEVEVVLVEVDDVVVVAKWNHISYFSLRDLW